MLVQCFEVGKVVRGVTLHFVDVHALVFVVNLAEVLYGVELEDDGVRSGVAIWSFRQTLKRASSVGSLKSRFGIRAKKKESPGAYWMKRRTSLPRGSVSGCGSMSMSGSLGGCSEDEEGAGASGTGSLKSPHAPVCSADV